MCGTLWKYATVTAALWWGLGSNLCLSSSLCDHRCQVASASSQRPPPVCHEGIKPHLPGRFPPVAQKKSVCREEMASVLGNVNYCFHQHIASPLYRTFDIETVCFYGIAMFVVHPGLAEMERFKASSTWLGRKQEASVNHMKMEIGERICKKVAWKCLQSPICYLF